MTGVITADPNPVRVSDRSGLGVTTLSWTSEGVEMVEVRVGAPDGPLFSRSGPVGQAQTGQWVSDGMIFYLQDVSGGLPLTSAHTLATVTVKVEAAAGERSPRALILIYHRVAEVCPDPWSLCVRPQHFAEQLEVLRKHARVLRLRELVAALLESRLPDQSVVVTFDDGYADNLSQAKPLLERYGIPATCFLTTGWLGCAREFWWDELDRLLLQSGSLPETLRLKIRGEEYHWELGEAARYDAEAYHSHRRWRAWGEPDPSPRHLLYRAIYRLLYPLPEAKRRAAQDELLAWAGAELAARPSHRPLSHQEIAALAEGDLIEIGAHTITHSLLAAAPTSVQRREIVQSKAQLEELVGQPVRSFAYPFGKRGDYTEETVTIVRESGFACACSNFPGAVTGGVDHFQLPRMFVEDCDGEEFTRQLWLWLKA